MIRQLAERSPPMAELLMDLEADDDHRTRLEQLGQESATPSPAVPALGEQPAFGLQPAIRD
jgi:hypothetical protein